MTDIEVQTVEEFQRRTDQMERIWTHYDHAREKHPYFCDSLYPKDYTLDMAQFRCRAELSECRELIKKQMRGGVLQWDSLLNCEVWKAHEAVANGDNAAAVEELYDCIAVLLRTIDVLEERQMLGKPDTISCNDAGE